MAHQVLTRRFNVDDYYKMAAAGILGPDDHVELLRGEIVEMSPIGRLHAAVVMRLNELLQSWNQGRFQVGVQSPVRLSTESEPEPDIALLRRRDDFYAAGHPGPADVLLLVEVADSSADSSADFDRQVKLPLYAQAGIPEVWLVDLPAGCIEVHRRPGAGGYGDVRRLRGADRLVFELLPGFAASAAEVLGSS